MNRKELVWWTIVNFATAFDLIKETHPPRGAIRHLRQDIKALARLGISVDEIKNIRASINKDSSVYLYSTHLLRLIEEDGPQ